MMLHGGGLLVAAIFVAGDIPALFQGKVMARIAVSGGGIAGMAAALAGAKAGHDVVLFSGETNGGAAAPLPAGSRSLPMAGPHSPSLGYPTPQPPAQLNSTASLCAALGEAQRLFIFHLPEAMPASAGKLCTGFYAMLLRQKQTLIKSRSILNISINRQTA